MLKATIPREMHSSSRVSIYCMLQKAPGHVAPEWIVPVERRAELDLSAVHLAADLTYPHMVVVTSFTAEGGYVRNCAGIIVGKSTRIAHTIVTSVSGERGHLRFNSVFWHVHSIVKKKVII